MAMQIEPSQTPLFEASYAMTFGEFAESYRLLQLASSRGRKLRYLFYVRYGYAVALTLLTIGAIGVVRFWQPGGTIAAEWGVNGHITNLAEMLLSGVWPPIFVGMAVFGFSALFTPSSYRRKLRKDYKDGRRGKELTAKVFEEGLYLQGKDDTADTRISWNGFEQWVESREMFVLLRSRVQCFAIPKRALGPGQEEQLRELLTANIPAPKNKP